MKPIRRTALALAALALSVGAGAAAEPSASEGARRLYQISGLETRTAMIDDRVLQRLRAEPDLPSEAEMNRIVAAVNAAYAPAALEQEILRQLEAGYDPALAAETFAWYETDLGEKLRELDEEISKTSFETVQNYAESLGEKPPTDERMSLIRRIDATTGATSGGVEVAVGTGLGVQIALQAARGEPIRADEIRQRAESQRPQLYQMFQAVNLAGLLYGYRSLSDTELVELLQFAQTDAGKWYFESTGRSFGKVVIDASTRLEKELSHATPSHGE